MAVASAFFTELFGWKVQVQAHGGPIDTGSAVPGGMHRDPGPPQHYLYFAVDDIEAAMKRVVELGGEVEPMRPRPNSGVPSSSVGTTRVFPSGCTYRRKASS